MPYSTLIFIPCSICFLCLGEDKIYQNKLESQRNLATKLEKLEKTLQFSREDSEAYTTLEDAYDEEVEVSLSKQVLT